MFHLTKQRFIGELNQYLAFMPDEERKAVLDSYGCLFDGDEEHDAETVARLGSAMKVAIEVRKTYHEGGFEALELTGNAGKQPDAEEDIQESAEDMEASEEPVMISEDEEFKESGSADVTEAEADEAAEEEAAEEESIEDAVIQAVAQVMSEEDEAEMDAEAEASEEEETPEIAEAEPEDAAESEPKEKRMIKKVRPVAAFFYTIAAVAVSLVLLILTLAVGLVLFASGAALIVSGVKLVLIGFTKMALLSDLLLTAGAGAAVFAIGVLLAWFGIWLCVKIFGGVIGGAVRLGKRLCTKEVEADE